LTLSVSLWQNRGYRKTPPVGRGFRDRLELWGSGYLLMVAFSMITLYR